MNRKSFEQKYKFPLIFKKLKLASDSVNEKLHSKDLLFSNFEPAEDIFSMSVHESTKNFNETSRTLEHESMTNSETVREDLELENTRSHRTFLNGYSKTQELKLVKIGLASSERIQTWAEKTLPNKKIFGEVLNANTLHYKTFKPHKGGLFCERIFGPLKDFECACGIKQKPFDDDNYVQNLLDVTKRQRVFCGTCDVEYTWSIIRRYQLGYIRFAAPVTHLWYLKTNPSYLSLILDIRKKDLEAIIYCMQTITLEYYWKPMHSLQLNLTPKNLFASYHKVLNQSVDQRLNSKKKDRKQRLKSEQNTKRRQLKVDRFFFPSFNPSSLMGPPSDQAPLEAKIQYLEKSFRLSTDDNHPRNLAKLSQMQKFFADKSSTYTRKNFFMKNSKKFGAAFYKQLYGFTTNLQFELDSSRPENSKTHATNPFFLILKERLEKKRKFKALDSNEQNIEPKRTLQISLWNQTQDSFWRFLQIERNFSNPNTSKIYVNFIEFEDEIKDFLSTLYQVFSSPALPKTSSGILKTASDSSNALAQVSDSFEIKNVFDKIEHKTELKTLRSYLILCFFFVFREKQSSFFGEISDLLTFDTEFDNFLAFIRRNVLETMITNLPSKRLCSETRAEETQPLKSTSFSEDAGFQWFDTSRRIAFDFGKLVLKLSYEISFSTFLRSRQTKYPRFSNPSERVFTSEIKSNQDLFSKQPFVKISANKIGDGFKETYLKLSSNKKVVLISKNTESYVTNASLYLRHKKNNRRALTTFKKNTKSRVWGFSNNIYTTSYLTEWQAEKDWRYFLYYNTTPIEMVDRSSAFYVQRLNAESVFSFSLSSVPVFGANLVQKLLVQYEGPELKTMTKQYQNTLPKLNRYIRYRKQISQKKADYVQIQKLLQKRDQIVRRLKLLRKLFKKNSRTTAMVLKTLPVLPPDLRPILKMQNQIAASDLNRFYQRILYRNDRLKKFLRANASFNVSEPGFEIKYAQRLLQEAVDNLIQNGKGNVKPETNSRGQPLKSLSEILKGKQGRFRQYLLGKRVDYSGRSVIVVGPSLKIYECGLPFEMAIELFLPFVIKKIFQYNFARTVIGAKTILKTDIKLTWELLEEVMKSHPVLLNRAPTLHRLGIQAFQPRLIEGRAILLHPLVCPAFNADFDGDQMAVHVPITVEARTEAWKLIFARNHLISPATGESMLLPSQDMVLGCYYLTTEALQYPRFHSGRPFRLSSSFYFSNLDQVLQAYFQEKIHLQTPIWLKWFGVLETDQQFSCPVEIQIARNGTYTELRPKLQKRFLSTGTCENVFVRTTAGRVLFNVLVLNCLQGN